jgi:hypothetical protein
MKRCRAEGRDRFELWVAAAVVANNLMRIAALLTKRLQTKNRLLTSPQPSPPGRSKLPRFGASRTESPSSAANSGLKIACPELVDAGVFCQFVPNLSAQVGLLYSIHAFRDRN